MKGIGHTLLHSFGWDEAKRSLRWYLKLKPNCAMARGSLARGGLIGFTRGDCLDPERKNCDGKSEVW